MGTCVTPRQLPQDRPQQDIVPQPHFKLVSSLSGHNPESSSPKNLLHKDDMIHLRKKRQYHQNEVQIDQKGFQGSGINKRQKTRESLNMEYSMAEENSMAIQPQRQKKPGILESKRQRRNSENIEVTREYSLCASEMKQWLRRKSGNP